MFGSRARARPKPYSDLDLALLAPAFEPVKPWPKFAGADGNDLPMRVDLLDWASTAPASAS